MNKSEDVIYRQAALDTIEKFSCCGYIEEDVEKLFKALNDLPPAQPERPKGQWIIIAEFEDCYYAKCNQCNITQVFYFNKPLTNFCPNCGSDMRGEENE